MAIKNLYDTTIKQAKPKEKAYTLSDGGGLQLLVKPSGSKLWEFYYQSPTLHKRRKTSLGTYPDVSLEIAREKRQNYLNLIHRSIDPIDHYQKTKEETKNVTDGIYINVVDEWLKLRNRELKSGVITPRTYQRTESLLKDDVFAKLKNTNIKDIKHLDLAKAIQTKGETALDSAKKLIQYLNRLWLYAISQGYCDFNIVSNIDRKSILPKKQVVHYSKITDLAILSELIKAIYKYTGHYSVKNTLKFVLHVPLRASNLVTLKWEYIDFDKKILTIPRAEMKVRDSNLNDFVMSLSDEVIEILKDQYQYTSNKDYIFIADYGSHVHAETPNRVLQRLGFNDETRGRKQRLHSFRGTFRSLADTHQLEHNAIFEVKEIALDHHVGNTASKAYNDKANYLPQLKPLMEWWSGFIVEMVDEVKQ